MMRRALPVLGLLAALSGCEDDLPNDRTWQSSHFRYHTRSSDDGACADLLAVLDEHWRVTNVALGNRLPDTTVVDYFKFVDQSDLNGNGPCEQGVACTDGTRVMTAAAFHQHELIHAYLFSIGFPPWLFVEGTAVALSCQVPLYGRPAADSWTTALTADRHDTALFAAGGWLVADLLAKHGPEKYLRLYADLPHGADANLVASTFQTIYGTTLDDAWAQAMSRDTAPPSCLWECAQPPLNGSANGHPAPTCGLDDISLTFDAPAGGGAFILESAGAHPVEIGSCGPNNDSPGRSAIPPWKDGMAVVGWLAPGSYFLGFDPPAGALTFAFPPTPPVGSDCATIAPIDTSRFSVTHVVMPRGANVLSASLSTSARDVEILTNAQVGETQVQLCRSCAANDCLAIPRNTIVPATTSGTSIVRVTASLTDRSYVTTTIRSSPLP